MYDSDLFESSANIMKEDIEPTKNEIIKKLAEEWNIPIISLKLAPITLGDLAGTLPNNKNKE